MNCDDKKSLLDEFHALMAANADIAHVRIAAEKWTLAEMTGHLIDSAANNHQRFIRLQLCGGVLEFPAYDATEWRDVSYAGDFDFTALAGLWRSLNEYLLHVIRHIREGAVSHVWNINGKSLSLEFLVRDYFGHMELHLAMFRDRAAEIRAMN